MRRTVVVAATLTALTLTAPAFAADAPPTDPGLQRQKGYDAAARAYDAAAKSDLRNIASGRRDFAVTGDGASTQGVLSLLR